MSNDGEGFAIILLAVATFVIGAWAGYMTGRDTMRKEAIAVGVAEYIIVDQADGTSEFQWRKQQ